MEMYWRLKISHFEYDYYSRLISSSIIGLKSPGGGGEFLFLGGKWKYRFEKKDIPGQNTGEDVRLSVQLVEGEVKECNIALECVIDGWSVQNYVLLPAAAYNGNRFESRRIFYSPKLLDPKDIGPTKPPVISDVPGLNIHDGPSCIDEVAGSMSTPSMGFYAPSEGHGFWMFSQQKTSWGDNGYRVTENRERTQAVFSISAPAVRELYKYKITDNQHPSDDKAPDWHVGDKVSLQVHSYWFACNSLQSFFDFWNRVRYHLIPKPADVCSFPFSSTFHLQEKKFNEQNWVERYGYYSVGVRNHFLQDWQIGWTGGMISTYPLLFEGEDTTKNRVLRNFDFLFPNGISPSGFFYDSGESKDDAFYWYGGDVRRPHTVNWHLVRKSGDGLYYVLKQFQLMERTNLEIKKSWNEGARKVAESFVTLWNRYHQTGHYLDSRTGELIVGGSTSGGIVPAALAYASVWYKKAEYLDVAEKVAEYLYSNFVVKGLSMGGVGDALQNPDSESAYGMLESFAVLYEQTGKNLWLKRAEEMASQFFTWIMGYNYEFPADCTLGKMGIKTLGTVFANTQNKHGAPGICTYSGVALLRIFRATGNLFYAEMLKDIVRFIPQLLSHPEKPIPGMPIGWITERVSTNDWFEGTGELMIGSTWAETALMLTTIEIPGIYVVPQKELIFVFDSIDARLIGVDTSKIVLEIENPSRETVDVRIFIDNESRMKYPLGENFLLEAEVVNIAPNGSKQVIIPQ